MQNIEGLTVSEVRRLFNAVEKLFHVCSFGSEYVTTLYLNGTQGGKPIKKDIEEVLDLLV